MNLGHGGNIDQILRSYDLEEIIDFSANINPMGISKKVKEEMIKALSKIERYPDITYFELKKAISDYEQINKENIVLGNGAAEIIFNIVRALKPKKALIPAPTFSEYEDALNSVNCDINHYILKDKYSLDDDFISKITRDIDIIFVCNPNNPTGSIVKREFILQIIKKAKEENVTVVLDESFLEFVKNKKDYSSIRFLGDFKNLIVVKSLTKIFAFPGIRLGYAITSNDEHKESIESVSVPWSVNTVADYGGRVALKQVEYIKKSVDYVSRENEFLYNNLKSFKEVDVFKGAVNFIFFRVNKKIDLKEQLLKRGILIRCCSNYIGLDNSYYRIAVRTREENLRFIEVLKKVL